jgi:hypothetical protein
MKLSINAIKELATKAISPKKAEKAAEVSIKDGERMIANGQDAAAIQGRAMVKPYEKPQMEKANLTKENTKAASGGPRDWGEDPEDDVVNEYNEMYNTLWN